MTTTTPGSSREVQTTTTTEMNARELQASGRAQEATQTGNQTYAVKDTTSSTEYTPPTTTTVPVYHPQTAPCKLGVLSVQPERPSESAKKSGGLQDIFAGVMPASARVPNGLRMAGTYYGQSGASVEFLADKAIVGCHETVVEHPYTVALKAGQLLVNLEGNGGSQAFTLTPEGTLLGDNARVSLYGRRKIGEDQLGDPKYAPSSDACSYGDLSPRGASQSSGGITQSPVITSAPRHADTNITPSSQNSSAAGGTGALSIAAGFVGQLSNPLAGVPVLFLKESAEDVLRKDGFVNPAGKSALALWAEACKTGSPNCAKGTQAIQRARVNAAKFDVNGHVAFANVPVGPYWAVTEIRYNNKSYVWNLRIDVRTGSNAVSLDQNNPTIVF
jgi:hypothetical protein